MRKHKPETSLNDYRRRMARVLDYINDHLDDDLDLDTLAEVACLSRFHWHRTYRGITGETARRTVQRLKLNRASQELKDSTTSLAKIGRRAGYATSESFARAFKQQFGLTPASFRKSNDVFSRVSTIQLENFEMNIRTKDLNVEIKTLPSHRLAALHHYGPYNGSAAFNKLFKQTQKQELMEAGNIQLIGLYFDDPAAVDAEKLHSIAGLAVQPQTKIEPPLEIIKTHAGKYAVFDYKGPYENLGLAYDWIIGTWLPNSGHTPADHPSMDFYLNNPMDNPPEALLTQICIPLE